LACYTAGSERPTASVLASCAAIVLAQDHVAARLTKAEASLIAEAVKSGIGLVNFDCDLRHVHAPLHEIFDFGRLNPHAIATELVRMGNHQHYITDLQLPGEYHQFDRMVTAIIAEEWGERERSAPGRRNPRQGSVRLHPPLLALERLRTAQLPGVVRHSLGLGKAVQFTLNPRVWRKTFFDHARDTDDLFWRSILWAVRKPFAANMVPPFVTLSVDDCVGRHDTKYADVASQCKFVPTISLCLKSVPGRFFPKIKAGLESGNVQYKTHALDYNTPLTFNFGKGECTRDELDERFAFNDSFWKKVGARPGATLRLHGGECGVKGVPYFKERGHVLFCLALQTGLHNADMCMNDGFWPYDLQTCYYDCLPDDHDYFSFGAFVARHQEDFLTGCTPNWRESDRTNVDKALRRAAQTAPGRRGCFYAEIVTHEQKIGVLALKEWDGLLKGGDKMTNAYGKIFVSHDHVANTLKAKTGFGMKTPASMASGFTASSRAQPLPR